MLTLPYGYEFNPQSDESHLRSKSFQHVCVMSTRLLNACPQLSVGQGTCTDPGDEFLLTHRLLWTVPKLDFIVYAFPSKINKEKAQQTEQDKSERLM